MSLNLLSNSLRSDFPILSREGRGGNLVYLDSAATSQKPKVVMESVVNYYSSINATIHRSGHELGELASVAYDTSRATISQFVGIDPANLIFTKNATESLNLIVYALLNASLLKSTSDIRFTKYALSPGDEILLTQMEHHANLVPWQHLAKTLGLKIKFLEVDDDGRLTIDESLFSNRTKVVALTHQSNVLGTINPVAKIVSLANKVNAIVVLDACQSVPHLNVDFNSLGVAAAAWSGHKMLGPTGVGCLYLNSDLLENLPPFLMGGNMIENVTFTESTYRKDNAKFEAGTMNVAQVVGLATAVEYLNQVGINRVHQHEQVLTTHAINKMKMMSGIRILGPLDMVDRGGVISFEVEGVHPHDVSQYLDAKGIAIRAGHHCAWPLHRRMNAKASSRVSFYLYNTLQEVDYFLEVLDGVQSYFKVTS